MTSVCIIDDDDIFQYTSIKCLKSIDSKIDIKSFTEPENALIFLKNNSMQVSAIPDLIILDLNMPRLSGWDFLERYEKFFKDLPKQSSIVMVTSSLNNIDRLKASTYSLLDDYRIKPMGFDEYVDLLTRHLGIDSSGQTS